MAHVQHKLSLIQIDDEERDPNDGEGYFVHISKQNEQGEEIGKYKLPLSDLMRACVESTLELINQTQGTAMQIVGDVDLITLDEE